MVVSSLRLLAAFKDGPSAGVTMATALISLALDIPVRWVFFVLSRKGVIDEVGRPDVAMTGELTLMGKVLKARRFHQIWEEENCHLRMLPCRWVASRRRQASPLMMWMRYQD